MTVTITYASLTTLINALDDDKAVAENIIDHAINLLVAHGAAIDNLTGVAEAKTGDYTQAQAGAILTLAVAVYSSMYITKGGSNDSYQLLGVSSSTGSSGGGGASSLQGLAKELAKRLKGSSIAFVVAEDTSGLDEAT